VTVGLLTDTAVLPLNTKLFTYTFLLLEFPPDPAYMNILIFMVWPLPHEIDVKVIAGEIVVVPPLFMPNAEPKGVKVVPPSSAYEKLIID